MLWEDKWKFLLMALQISIFIYTINISFGTIQYLSKLNHLVRQTGIREAAYFSLNGVISSQQNKFYRESRTEDPDKMIENKIINHLNDVINNDLAGFVQELSISRSPAFDLERKAETTIEVYSGKNIKFELTKGRWFNYNDENKVVISQDLSSYYKVGDKVLVSVKDYLGQRHDITIEIIGILKSDYAFAFNRGGNSNGLDSIFSPTDNLMIAGRLTGENGTIIGNDSIGRLLFPDKKQDTQRLFGEWQQKLNLYGNLTPIEIMAKRTEESNKSKLLEQLVIEFIIFLLAITGLGANNFLTLLNKKREFSVYFLCGLRFKSCILLSTIKNLFIILIPSIASFAVIKLEAISGGNYSMIIDMNNVILCLLIICLIYLITAIPVYIKMRTASPVELFREE